MPLGGPRPESAKETATSYIRLMTPAHVRVGEEVEVAFLESARFYRLLSDNPQFDRILDLLRRGAHEGIALRIGCDGPASEVIRSADPVE